LIHAIPMALHHIHIHGFVILTRYCFLASVAFMSVIVRTFPASLVVKPPSGCQLSSVLLVSTA